MRAGAPLAAVAAFAALAAGTAAAGERSPRAIYVLRCSGCHLPDGAGLPSAGIPPLKGFIDSFVRDEDGRTYVVHVPGVAGSGLDDRATAAVLNYVMAQWGAPAAARPFTADEVARRRSVRIADVVAFRRRLVRRLEAEGVTFPDYPWP